MSQNVSPQINLFKQLMCYFNPVILIILIQEQQIEYTWLNWNWYPENFQKKYKINLSTCTWSLFCMFACFLNFMHTFCHGFSRENLHCEIGSYGWMWIKRFFFIRIKFRGNDFTTSMIMYDPSFHISKLFRTLILWRFFCLWTIYNKNCFRKDCWTFLW